MVWTKGPLGNRSWIGDAVVLIYCCTHAIAGIMVSHHDEVYVAVLRAYACRRF